LTIVFTGPSSFTGAFFVKKLLESGYTVFALFRKNTYEGLRQRRIEMFCKNAKCVFSCPFGGDLFFETIKKIPKIDFFCHHAAKVKDYKSCDFDPIHALENNTRRLKQLLPILKQKRCRGLILTGSVFEPGEGVGSDNLRAVSPYGLSKGLTAEFFRYYTEKYHMPLGKFVIPNPFGPYEEPKFTAYLAKSWLQGKIPHVETPFYVRDNIPVTVLAESYLRFLDSFEKGVLYKKAAPSCFVETQGAFTKRFSKEMQKRFRLHCPYTLAETQTFDEPEMRTNLDPIDFHWDREAFFDEVATFYQKECK